MKRAAPDVKFHIFALAVSLLWMPFASAQPDASTHGETAELAPLISGLGNRLVVQTVAPSWAVLCAMARPTFTWHDRDLIWVEDDADGRPVFRLDRAWRYRDGSGRVQWVLLGIRDGEWDEAFGQVMGDNLEGRPRLVAGKPTSDHGSGDYVLVLETDDRCGTVYEVGWQKLMANGTSLAIEERRIYFRRTREGGWELLGEGPAEGHGKTGPGESHQTRSVPRVVWTGDPACSCRIEFLLEHRDYRWATEADGQIFNRELPPVTVRYEHAALDSASRQLKLRDAPTVSP